MPPPKTPFHIDALLAEPPRPNPAAPSPQPPIPLPIPGQGVWGWGCLWGGDLELSHCTGANPCVPAVPWRSGGACKMKRARTVFKPEQLERLEQEFLKQQYMVGTERVDLAATLHLTETQVKVWFQNRRIKWRKQSMEQKKAKLSQFGVIQPASAGPTDIKEHEEDTVDVELGMQLPLLFLQPCMSDGEPSGFSPSGIALLHRGVHRELLRHTEVRGPLLS